ncbi:MAG: hypothetical protein ACLSGS_08935 [Adlercreutzia sp.]
MDNVVLVTFEDEGKAYEEFNHLKDNEATADFTILEMAVVKNVDGAIMVPDGYQDGYDETDNTAFGGVIGAVVGLLGGPVGVLLGAGIGLVAGIWTTRTSMTCSSWNTARASLRRATAS